MKNDLTPKLIYSIISKILESNFPEALEELDATLKNCPPLSFLSSLRAYIFEKFPATSKDPVIIEMYAVILGISDNYVMEMFINQGV